MHDVEHMMKTFMSNMSVQEITLYTVMTDSLSVHMLK